MASASFIWDIKEVFINKPVLLYPKQSASEAVYAGKKVNLV
jgi:hypothetical protein